MGSPDVTDAAQQSLISRLVDEELKRSLDHAAEGLHWVGADGGILWANQTELDMLGYRADEYVGRHIAEFHLDAECIADILARLARGESLHQYPARLRHKDGTARHVQINSKGLWQNDTFLRTQCFTRDVTEQHVTDDAARRLAQVVEGSEDAIISQDLDGTITSWNAAAERLYGHARADAIGQPIQLIMPADRGEEERRVIDQVRDGERVPSFDTVRRHKSGRLVDVALTISPIRDRDGRIIGASKTARDISDRKRIEARDRFLVELDDAVRPLSAAEAITLTAATVLGTHLAVSRCAYAAVEDDQDTFTLTGNFTNGVHSIVGRYTFRQFGEECRRQMRAGEPYVVSDSEADSRLDEHDRESYRQTAIRAVICVPVMKQERVVAAMAVHVNTQRTWRLDEIELVQRVANRCWESIERAKVTQSLRESEARFRALASTNSALTLYEQDRDLRYTWVFPSHDEFAEDNVGQTDAELLPAAEGERLTALKREVLSTGVRRRFETTVTLPNDMRTYDLIVEPRFDPGGNIVGLGGIAFDITERKQNELLLAEAQQSARQSEARLREADRRKDEFLAMLAHELRNPLAPIRTGLHLIGLAGDSPAAVQQVRSMMERQLAHVVRLVDDLLDVSRITSGKIHLQRRPVHLQELIDSAIEANRAAIDGAGITLSVDPGEASCELFVDPTRGVQIISNVLNNAVKFTGPHGRVEIVASRPSAGDRREVAIAIADNGAGISAAMLPRVFELFVQGDEAPGSGRGGLGLGLALARTLVEMHGGTIDAYSDGIGQGSTFLIRLPVAPEARSLAEPETSRRADAAGRRVLIVDDNVDSSAILAMIVRRLGGEAMTVGDGEAAIAAVGEFRPDTVLLDIGLPGIDGYETCRRIRHEHGHGVRLIALTGWGQEQDKRHATDAGFDVHLTKPADPLALEALLTDTPPSGLSARSTIKESS